MRIKYFLGCTMKTLLSGSMLALGSSILAGRWLQGTRFVRTTPRHRTMGIIALSLATVDVVSIGGVFLGSVGAYYDVDNFSSLARCMRISCESLFGRHQQS
jgi:hypothetical protein